MGATAMTDDGKVLFVRVMLAFFWLAGGAALQIAFWKTSDNTYFEALVRHGYLWFVYFFPAHILAEQCLRLIKRRKRAREE